MFPIPYIFFIGTSVQTSSTTYKGQLHKNSNRRYLAWGSDEGRCKGRKLLAVTGNHAPGGGFSFVRQRAFMSHCHCRYCTNPNPDCCPMQTYFPGIHKAVSPERRFKVLRILDVPEPNSQDQPDIPKVNSMGSSQ